MDRQTAKNPYHLYGFFFLNALAREKQGDAEKTSSVETIQGAEGGTTITQVVSIPLGLVQFGRMPTKGYPEGDNNAHHPILRKFMALGLTRQTNEAAGLADSNTRSS